MGEFTNVCVVTGPAAELATIEEMIADNVLYLMALAPPPPDLPPNELNAWCRINWSVPRPVAARNVSLTTDPAELVIEADSKHDPLVELIVNASLSFPTCTFVLTYSDNEEFLYAGAIAARNGEFAGGDFEYPELDDYDEDDEDAECEAHENRSSEVKERLREAAEEAVEDLPSSNGRD